VWRTYRDRSKEEPLMSLAKIALAAVAGALLVGVAGIGRPDAARSAAELDRAITVAGSGSVSVVPDRARFAFGVETRARTAAEALQQNADVMRKVIAALKTAGVADRDVQTEQVSLSPVYSDDDDAVIGYSASNTVGVVVHKIAEAGSLVDTAVAAGANQVYGPALDRANRDELYRKALEAALADARAKAQTIASAAGLTLGRPTTVQELSAGPPVMADERAAAPTQSTPIEAGRDEIEASVTVTFAAS
jgi:uncharacterized protein